MGTPALERSKLETPLTRGLIVRVAPAASRHKSPRHDDSTLANHLSHARVPASTGIRSQEPGYERKSWQPSTCSDRSLQANVS